MCSCYVQFLFNHCAVVRAVILSHQVVGSKQPLRRFCGGKTCLGLSLSQTPLMWEPPALGLPLFHIEFCLFFFCFSSVENVYSDKKSIADYTFIPIVT